MAAAALHSASATLTGGCPHMATFNASDSATISYPFYHFARTDLLPWISDKHLSIAAPFITYWVLSSIFQFIDWSHLPIFEHHRIHTLEETKKMNRRVGIVEVITTVLFQQVLQTSLGLIWLVDDDPAFGPLRDHQSDLARWNGTISSVLKVVFGGERGAEITKTFGPSLASFVFWYAVPLEQLFVALVVLDAWQYFWHRVVHESNYLYRKIHCWHHLLYAPFAFGALYNHPLEGFLLDTFGAALAHTVAGMTTRQGIVFFALSTAKTVDDHCGFKMKYDPFQALFGNSADYHDIHHQLGGLKKNYQQPWFRYLDYFLGTQMTRPEFEELKLERARRRLKGLKITDEDEQGDHDPIPLKDE